MSTVGSATRRRPPFGILDAAGLLALALGLAWLLAPLPRSRRDASLEVRLRTDVVAVAEALRLRADAGGDYAALEDLLRDAPDSAAALRGWEPSKEPGTLRGHGCWLQVLLPDKEGRAVAASESDPESRDRGFLVLAWPMEPSATHARGQLAMSGGVAWQFDGTAPESSSGPPLPNVTFPRHGAVEADPPYGWAVTRRWWKAGRKGGR